MLKTYFQRNDFDHYVYVKNVNTKELVYLLLYINDMLLATKSKVEVGRIKTLLSTEFDMKKLGHAKRILEMEISSERNQRKIHLLCHHILRNWLQILE